MRAICSALCGFVLLALLASAVDARVWTDINGKKIDAEFRGLDGDKALLFFKGKEWRVPLKRLSQEDRWHIESVTVFDDDPVEPESSKEAGKPSKEEEDFDFPIPENIPEEAREAIKKAMEEHRQHAREMRERSGKPPGESAADVKRHALEFEAQQRDRDARRREKEEQREREREQRRKESQARMEQRRKEVAEREAERERQLAAMPVHVYKCGSCDHQWESRADLKAGTKCPNCRVTIEVFTDEDGKITSETSLAKTERYAGYGRMVLYGALLLAGIGGVLKRVTG